MRADLKRLKRDTGSSRQVAAVGAETSNISAPGVQTTSGTSTSVLAAPAAPKRGLGKIAVTTFVVLAAAAVGGYFILHRSSPIPFQDFSITQVTNYREIGNHRHIAGWEDASSL